MCKITINGVNITLTEEQLKQIDEQRNKKKINWKDIQSVLDAIDYLGERRPRC